MTRLLAKFLLLTCLCLSGTAGYAQNGLSNKRKLAIAPALAPLPPPAVPHVLRASTLR